MATSTKTAVNKIIITTPCLTRLQEASSSVGKGCILLIGFTNGSSAFIKGFYVVPDSNVDQLYDTAFKVNSMLPGGVYIIGLCHISQTPDDAAELKKYLLNAFNNESRLQNIIGLWLTTTQFDAQLPYGCLVVSLPSQSTSRVLTSDLLTYIYNIEESELIDGLEVSFDPDTYSKESLKSGISREVMFRVRGNIDVGFHHSNKPELRHREIKAELMRLKQRLLSGPSLVFRLADTDILLHNRPAHDGPKGTLVGSTSVLRLVDMIKDKRSGDQRRLQVNESGYPIDIQMLVQSTGVSESNGNSVSCAPIIHHTHESYKYVQMTLGIDVLTYTSCDCSVTNLSCLLSAAISRQIDAIMATLLLNSNGYDYHIPRVYHFHPELLDHSVTVIYPENLDTKQLEPQRRSLHEGLSLPLTHPMFRAQNALLFYDTYHVTGSDSPGYLTNVHEGLPTSEVPGGTLHMVRGRYHYHHYMQDRLNDDGWGCAYRSLQTVVSWLRLQGYTDQPVPSHTQIQQALVDVGDKDKSFVGSKKWIGSTELSYVLDHLYNITCKILHVSSGAEMSYKARDLAHHFDTHQSPVMIGGGVLAHTILGVNWNESTGDVKFLILDPHYSGAEDIKTIQDKGWCGWKGPDFWVQNVYYNMCMPQAPQVF